MLIGTKLDLKYLKEGETVYPGAVFEFPGDHGTERYTSQISTLFLVK
jgi:hypothetical protein